MADTNNTVWAISWSDRVINRFRQHRARAEQDKDLYLRLKRYLNDAQAHLDGESTRTDKDGFIVQSYRGKMIFLLTFPLEAPSKS